MSELAEYIQTAEDNKVEMRSRLQGFRSDQLKKLAAAREILKLVEPGAKTDPVALKAALKEAIETNTEATVRTPFRGAGKLDRIFRDLLTEANKAISKNSTP